MGFLRFGVFSLGSRPAFFPYRLYFRVCVSAAVFLSSETSFCIPDHQLIFAGYLLCTSSRGNPGAPKHAHRALQEALGVPGASQGFPTLLNVELGFFGYVQGSLSSGAEAPHFIRELWVRSWSRDLGYFTSAWPSR